MTLLLIYIFCQFMFTYWLRTLENDDSSSDLVMILGAIVMPGTTLAVYLYGVNDE